MSEHRALAASRSNASPPVGGAGNPPLQQIPSRAMAMHCRLSGLRYPRKLWHSTTMGNKDAHRRETKKPKKKEPPKIAANPTVVRINPGTPKP
jgi:hypothetical protein